MNELEKQLDYCLGTEMPEPGRAIDVAPGVHWAAHGAAVRAQSHQPLAAARFAAGRGRRAGAAKAGRSSTAASTTRRRALPGSSSSRARSTACRCCASSSPTCTPTTSARRTGCASAGTRASGSAPPTSASPAWRAARAPASAGRSRRRSWRGTAWPPTRRGRRRRLAHQLLQEPRARVPSAYRRLLDGRVLAIGAAARRADWTCHVGYGHAPEHIALALRNRKRILISGDMVLPRISTNVSVVDVEPEADPLTLYLDSIERMRAIDAGVIVLPSHGLPFKGLHTRIEPAAGAPRRALRRNDRRLRRGAAERLRARPGAVQAPARPAPDDLRDGRVDRAPARALVSPASSSGIFGADGVIRFRAL